MKYYQINTKIKIKCGLINFWPFNNNYNDIIGEANLFGGSLVSLANDRFGRNSSAIDLNSGYIQAPSGVYFDGDFTVTFWMFVREQLDYGKVIDFGNGAGIDNVLIEFKDDLLGVETYDSNEMAQIWANQYFLNVWYFISIVLKGTTLSFYYNGTLVRSASAYVPNNIMRTKNYVGKSNWNGDPNANAVYDDLKFFNRALNQIEISIEMDSDF